MVDFAGWEMPLSYQGAIAEHLAVRQNVGLFDVSHMGCIEVNGQDAERYLDHISTNRITGRANGSTIYTIFCTDSGGCVDDVLVFRENSQRLFIVGNAINRTADWEHLRQTSVGFQVSLKSCYESLGILALQGPQSKAVLTKVLGQEISLKHMHFMSIRFGDVPLLISRSGYTGSLGYELIISTRQLGALWDAFLQQGAEEGIQPAGLAARDTLRLEAGYTLYGHELGPNIAPTESLASWTVHWDKECFLGKKALLQLETDSGKRSQYAVRVIDPGIPRQGNAVFDESRQTGIVTSGSYSPCLECGIAIIMVEHRLTIGQHVEIAVRDKRLRAEIVRLPFI